MALTAGVLLAPSFYGGGAAGEEEAQSLGDPFEISGRLIEANNQRLGGPGTPPYRMSGQVHLLNRKKNQKNKPKKELRGTFEKLYLGKGESRWELTLPDFHEIEIRRPTERHVLREPRKLPLEALLVRNALELEGPFLTNMGWEIEEGKVLGQPAHCVSFVPGPGSSLPGFCFDPETYRQLSRHRMMVPFSFENSDLRPAGSQFYPARILASVDDQPVLEIVVTALELSPEIAGDTQNLAEATPGAVAYPWCSAPTPPVLETPQTLTIMNPHRNAGAGPRTIRRPSRSRTQPVIVAGLLTTEGKLANAHVVVSRGYDLDHDALDRVAEVKHTAASCGETPVPVDFLYRYDPLFN